MKKAGIVLLLLFSLQAIAQPVIKDQKVIKGGVIKNEKNGTTKIGQKATVKVGAINSKYEINPSVAKLLASLPQQTFNINGRKTTVRLVSVDNPMVKRAINKQSSDGINQKMKDNGRTEDNDKICQNYQVRLSAESEDFDVPYSTQASYIYPGAAYMYDDYYKNTVSPKTITWTRNPIYLQAASSSAFGETELVQNPTSISLQQATGTIKKSLPSNPTNASTSIKMLTVNDETDFRFKVNAGGGGMGFKADASFGISNNSKKSYFMIDVIQSLYTINAVLPENDSATFFKESERNKTKGALFIASVSYGRRVLGVVETEFESEEMMASFKASYSAGFAGGYAGFDMLNGMKREKTTVKLFFVGGNANAISVPNPTAASVQAAINNYLATGTAQNAVPVKFTFRDMSMSLMRYESATDNYTYSQCTPKMPDVKYKATVSLVSVTNETNSTEGIKFGLVENAVFYKGNTMVDPTEIQKPIVRWGASLAMGPMTAYEEPRTFKGNTRIDRTVTSSAQYSQQEIFEGNARVDLITKYIAMYATRVFGSTNDKANVKTEKVYLKDVLNSKSGAGMMTKEVRINFNGRVFLLLFKISVVPA